jgi:hypothetical protein
VTTANITKATLVIAPTALNKTYDGTTKVNVTLTDNRVLGDVLTVKYKTATFATANAGSSIGVNVTGITVTGTDIGNYNFSTTATTTANIAQKTLTVSSQSAANKVYDGTTTAVLSKGKLTGLIKGDAVTLNQSGYFASSNAANRVGVVANNTIGGAKASNYLLVQPTTLVANITKALLSITATGVNKVYDNTINATVNLSGNVLSMDVGNVTISSTGAVFLTKTVGANKTINVSGISLNGSAAGNYYLSKTSATTKANITSTYVDPITTPQ